MASRSARVAARTCISLTGTACHADRPARRPRADPSRPALTSERPAGTTCRLHRFFTAREQCSRRTSPQRRGEPHEEQECRMRRKTLAALTAATTAGALGLLVPAMAGTSASSGYEPVLNPANFVRSITNPYFPLPVGRTLVYRGIRDGVTQIDTVHVTSQTRVLEGITATAVSDVATHRGKLLEKTTDWYAQDKQGNVWYLGERTAA